MDYRVVDVFTSKPLKGNPVAVVLSAGNLSTEQMQQLARWTNLSETTFVTKPKNGGDYFVRIFTPVQELSFAGHPSLGTAYALLDAGILERKDGEQLFIQECLRGNIPIKKLSTGELQFELEVEPPVKLSDVQFKDLQDCLDGLKLATGATYVDSGPLWVVVETDSIDRLLVYTQDDAAIKTFSDAYGFTGVCVFAAHGEHVEVRTFAPAVRVSEDPVCGSGNAAVARHRSAQSAYFARQGRAIHRDGVVVADSSDNIVHIGGHCVTVVRGSLLL